MSRLALSLGRSLPSIAFLGLTLLMTAASCSTGGTSDNGGSSPGSERGDLRGPCYPNKTCNAPYTCVSDLCVDLGGGGGQNSGGSQGQAGTGNSGGTGNQAGSGQAGSVNGTGGSTSGCAGKVYVAKQAPAALLVLLDRSSSMAGGKWAAASDAINAALDQSLFDSMSVGLLSAPGPGNVSGPECLFGLPVPCVVPSAPQVPLQEVGAAKATEVGLRGQIKAWLQGNGPQGGGAFDADASPLYDASVKALDALKAWPADGKRILLVVSDGTLSCASLSSRASFTDGNGCPDWEHPQNFIDLFQSAHNDPAKPVLTFVVGVPGADTYDPSAANYPPYHMRAALSAIAYAGAPEFVDPACTGKTFAQGDPDPSVACHFDMTKGGFDSQGLASIIAQVRGKALGCVFELPEPEGGGEVDKSLVNVQMNVGTGPQDIPKRSSASDTCSADYCWDYNAEGKIELIGKACSDLTTAPKAAVSVVAGCKTIIK